MELPAATWLLQTADPAEDPTRWPKPWAKQRCTASLMACAPMELQTSYRKALPIRCRRARGSSSRSQEGGHCSGDEERRGALSYLGRHYPRRYSDENRCVSHAGGIYRKARWNGDASRRLGRRSPRGRLARVLLHVRRSTSSRGAVICQQETAEGPTGNPTHDWCTLLRGSSLLDGGHSA